jgi:hypoxanthine phosphoribosyltransferase
METSPRQYLEQATLIHSADVVESAIAKIAAQLNHDYQDELPIVLCVMNGGAYFAGQLLAKLAFPLEFDYIQATRYRNSIQGQSVEWIQFPKLNLSNRRVIVLDDILDEGHTVIAIREECMRMGAQDVKIAVLVEKTLLQEKPIQAEYIGLDVPNLYVFGCGMDVYGWWRNLPAIYALAEK